MGTIEGKKILIMDDEVMIGEIACQMLSFLGYEARHVLDGEAAIQLFLNNEIKYLSIETIIEDCLNHFPNASNLSIEQMVELDAKVKDYVLHQRKELS